MKFRNLRADEMECRVQSYNSNKNGCILLIYKDARCDMNLLDEVVGVTNWQRKHTRDNKNCIVSVWCEDKKQWIEKEDAGTESNTEAQKGLASDSFKRACFNLGIGRELYTSPFIWITMKEKEIFKGKVSAFTKFHVADVEISKEKKITKLIIADQNGEIRFSFPKGAKVVRKLTINDAEGIVKNYLVSLGASESTNGKVWAKIKVADYFKDEKISDKYKEDIANIFADLSGKMIVLIQELGAELPSIQNNGNPAVELSEYIKYYNKVKSEVK